MYYIFGTGINAYSIIKGLKKLMKKKMFFLKDEDNISVCDKLAESFSYRNANKGILFFTEESNLKFSLQKNKENNIFYPKDIAFELIDDKLAFSKRLLELNEYPIDFNEDIYSTKLGYPFCVKGRYSWKESKKVPRGYVCKNKVDSNNAYRNIEKSVFSKDDFFIERFIEGGNANCFSVCGWHSRNNKLSFYIVTQKIYSLPENQLSGMIVKVVSDPGRLKKRTQNILNSINFEGVFELEFFYDLKKKKFYVLEINTRFWLQHQIFVDFYDNILIKRYIGNKDIFKRNSENRIIWVNTISLILNSIKFNFKMGSLVFKKFLSGYNISWAPSLEIATKYIIKLTTRKIKRVLKV